MKMKCLMGRHSLYISKIPNIYWSEIHLKCYDCKQKYKTLSLKEFKERNPRQEVNEILQVLKNSPF